jgi:hypothetical protein
VPSHLETSHQAGGVGGTGWSLGLQDLAGSLGCSQSSISVMSLSSGLSFFTSVLVKERATTPQGASVDSA